MWMFKGAIFDWDGVVIDSSTQHKKSWERFAAQESRYLPEGHFERGFGSKSDRAIREIFNWSQNKAEIERIAIRKEEIYREILKEEGLNSLPGVESLLKELKAAGISCAIGSSTELKNIHTAFELLGLKEYFSKIISAEDVAEGKPDPQVFIKAAHALGCDPKECVVFEDAPVGIEAGLAAGMTVIGVKTTHSAEKLEGAHYVVDSLQQFNLKTIENVVRSLKKSRVP